MGSATEEGESPVSEMTTELAVSGVPADTWNLQGR